MMGQKQKRILITLLGVSLVLNFAAAGYIGSRLVRDQVTASFFSAGLEQDPSPALADAYTRALSEDRIKLVTAFRDLRQARDRQQQTLTAPEYDINDHARLQAETRSKLVTVLEILHEALRKTASRLPDDERRAIPPFRLKPFQPGPDGTNSAK